MLQAFNLQLQYVASGPVAGVITGAAACLVWCLFVNAGFLPGLSQMHTHMCYLQFTFTAAWLVTSPVF